MARPGVPETTLILAAFAAREILCCFSPPAAAAVAGLGQDGEKRHQAALWAFGPCGELARVRSRAAMPDSVLTSRGSCC